MLSQGISKEGTPISMDIAPFPLISQSPQFYSSSELFAMRSRHKLPYRAVIHVAAAAKMRKPADMVLNQPMPMASMIGREAAVPAAAKKYRI